MKLTVVIPMYNESKIIEETAKKLWLYMSENFEEYQIIFSDDGSTDGCSDIVNGLGLPCVKVLRYEQNRGKGYAVRSGMMAADGDVCIFTDADLAYGTDVIKKATEVLVEKPDADMLIGSRNLDVDGYDGYTLSRKLMSKAYIKVLCIVGGFRLSDSQCGFKVFRKDAAKKIFSECTVDGFAFDLEVILRAGIHKLDIAEMPVKIINHRDSSIRPIGDAFKMLGDIKRIKKQIKRENTQK